MRSQGEPATPPADAATTESSEARIVRQKRFRIAPMTEDEAIEQMELLGHTFFLFAERETGKLNVLYRRNDGNYGLIVPETA
jgi:putative sigma-54 modulation protein